MQFSLIDSPQMEGLADLLEALNQPCACEQAEAGVDPLYDHVNKGWNVECRPPLSRWWMESRTTEQHQHQHNVAHPKARPHSDRRKKRNYDA